MNAGKLRNAGIAYYIRTPFSRSRPNEPERDEFNPVRMDYALSQLILKALEDTGIRPLDIGDAIFGCAYQRDENWTFGGRHPLFLAHLPPEIPSMAVDRACSSSMNAISIGAMEIMTGNADIVLAGGFEHMTHIPRLSNRLCERLLDADYSEYDMETGYKMGLTAEKLAEIEGIEREEMDRYAARSHRLASMASESGYLAGEILPISYETEHGTVVVKKDQSLRPDTTFEKISALKPAFKEGGRITAGNSSPLNAGASLVLLMSDEKLKEYGMQALAYIRSMGWAAVHPSIMGEGVVPSSARALKSACLSAEDIDLWEINEAFAVVVLNAIRKLKLEEGRVNTEGGAIAIGHPLGASGARIVGTLARRIAMGRANTGCASICVGGGQGYSIVLERAS